MLKSEHLIIFTRYPEPGKTKTRLIPALGAEGAAQLQRQMTQHTLAQVNALDNAIAMSWEVRFAGGDRTQMQTWLGTDLDYQPQGDGDLGVRMARAFQAAFEQGKKRVVTIGIDCPDLNAARLKQSLQLLQAHDLVLGPASDGGYYLIGLSRFIPELFVGVSWGTETVLQQTLAIAQSLNLSIAYLDELTDVDRPNDLWIWEKVQTELNRLNKPKISVIIPVLNEANRIQEMLLQLQQTPDLEIIVVDGGSQDETIQLANLPGVKVVASEPGRALQMNAGAEIATGDVLIFLHADTRLPEEFTQLIHQTLLQPNVVAGAFELKIDGVGLGLRLVEWGVKWRSRLLQMPYGDQAIFLRRETFKQLGGFATIPIMEDFEFVLRLRQTGQIAIAPASVLTSGRRWQTLGVFQTTVLNQIIIVGYYLGLSPARLAHWYRSVPSYQKPRKTNRG